MENLIEEMQNCTKSILNEDNNWIYMHLNRIKAVQGKNKVVTSKTIFTSKEFWYIPIETNPI